MAQEGLSETQAEVYDRQLRLWGATAQRRLGTARVLLAGLGALHAEVAKDIVLAGVGHVVLADAETVGQSDVAQNFLLRDSDVGKQKCDVCAERANSLNKMVSVRALKRSFAEIVDAEWLKGFDVVSVLDCPPPIEIELDTLCRQKGIYFLASKAHGFFGTVLVDAGKSYTYTETKTVEDGDKDATAIHRKNIPKSGPTEVVTSFPSFEAVRSMQWKLLPRRTSRLLAGLWLLDSFHTKHCRWPHSVDREQKNNLGKSSGSKRRRVDSPVEKDDWELLTAERDTLTVEHGQCSLSDALHDDELLRLLVENAGVEFVPVCAVVGGVVAGEITKFATGNGAPLRNWFFFDGFDGSGVVESVIPTP